MRAAITEWDKVRVDYVAGMSYEELCAKYSVKRFTLMKQISRNQWFKRKEKVKEQLHQVMSLDVLHDARSLVDQGNRLLADMAKDAQNAVQKLMESHASTGDSDIEALEKRERTAGMLVKRIKETCGLDDVKPTGLVVIGQFTRFEDEPSTKAIDVVSETSTGEQAKE